jgi:hypothetical protein
MAVFGSKCHDYSLASGAGLSIASYPPALHTCDCICLVCTPAASSFRNSSHSLEPISIPCPDLTPSRSIRSNLSSSHWRTVFVVISKEYKNLTRLRLRPTRHVILFRHSRWSKPLDLSPDTMANHRPTGGRLATPDHGTLAFKPTAIMGSVEIS